MAARIKMLVHVILSERENLEGLPAYMTFPEAAMPNAIQLHETLPNFHMEQPLFKGEDTAELFTPYPAEAMTYYPVSLRVNSVRNDDAKLIVRVDEGEPHAAADLSEPHPGAPEQDSLF